MLCLWGGCWMSAQGGGTGSPPWGASAQGSGTGSSPLCTPTQGGGIGFSTPVHIGTGQISWQQARWLAFPYLTAKLVKRALCFVALHA